MSPGNRGKLGTYGNAALNRFLSKFTSSKTDAKSLPALSKLLAKQNQETVESAGMNYLRMVALLGTGVSGLLCCATSAACSDEAEHGLACASYPWPHKGILSSYDHASIRRGHQV